MLTALQFGLQQEPPLTCSPGASCLKEADLEGKLPPIHDSCHKGVCGSCQVLLGPFPGPQQLLQDLWQDPLGQARLDKHVAAGRGVDLILWDFMLPAWDTLM